MGWWLCVILMGHLELDRTVGGRQGRDARVFQTGQFVIFTVARHTRAHTHTRLPSSDILLSISFRILSVNVASYLLTVNLTTCFSTSSVILVLSLSHVCVSPSLSLHFSYLYPLSLVPFLELSVTVYRISASIYF